MIRLDTSYKFTCFALNTNKIIDICTSSVVHFNDGWIMDPKQIFLDDYYQSYAKVQLAFIVS